MCVTNIVMVQQTLGWFGAYPGKQYAFREFAETIDIAAVPIIATKQLITPSIAIARDWIMRLLTSAYNICHRDHFEFCLHFDFFSIHSPSIYKLSMIRFVHKAHFDVDF